MGRKAMRGPDDPPRRRAPALLHGACPALFSIHATGAVLARHCGLCESLTFYVNRFSRIVRANEAFASQKR